MALSRKCASPEREAVWWRSQKTQPAYAQDHVPTHVDADFCFTAILACSTLTWLTFSYIRSLLQAFDLSINTAS